MPDLKKTLILLSLLVVSGCAPVISQKTLESVDREIRFSDIVKDPDKYRGQKVVLGGTIVSIDNKEEKTEIEVLDQPLNRQLKPTDPERSEGRFIAVFEGFKDPALYSRNRRITVAGVFKGIVKRKVGEMDYGYPVVESQEHYLWRSAYSEPSVGVGVGIGFGF
jgi:outer membrane lipoprotein